MMILRLAIILALSCGTLLAQETPEPAPAETTSLEPVVRVEFTPEAAVVGQPVVLRIKVLVPTWMPEPPAFPSMEAPNVIVRLPESGAGPISESVDGETWSGVSRAYRLYPMVPGPVTLPDQSIAITYADPETTQPVNYEAALGSISFTANVPEGAADLDPLILATGFTLEQELEGADAALGAGDAVTRTVTATITGTSALFIPPLVPDVSGDAVRSYPREPAVEETEERGTLSGRRSETVSYVAQYGGTAELPEISLDWFNTETNTVETATIEGATLAIDAPPPPVAARITARQVAVLLIGVVLLGLLGWGIWRYALPPLRRAQTARRNARLASEAHAARQVSAAIAAHDLSSVHRNLAIWVLRCSGDPAALDAALAAVGAARFGSVGAPAEAAAWRDLEAAFRAERHQRRVRSVTKAKVLPQLNFG